MSRPKAKANGIIVTSRKKIKLQRRLENEYGVQRRKSIQASVQATQQTMDQLSEEERIAELRRLAAPAIASSNALHAKGAALRSAAFAAGNKGKPIPVTKEQEEAVAGLPDVTVELSGTFTKEGWSEPQYFWVAEDDGWMTPETGWKNAICKMDGTKVIEVLNCPHKHKTPDAARACAIKAVKARSNSNVRVMDGWSADTRYPWTDGRVRALVDDVTGHKTDPTEGVAR